LEGVFVSVAAPKPLAEPNAFPYLNDVKRGDFNASNSTKTVRSNMDSIIKFGQYVKHIRSKKGLTQLQLSLKVFDKPNLEYIGRLERGVAAGITFATADKILWALESEMEFEMFVPDCVS